MSIHAAPFRALRIERLSREFGAVNALREVNLTVARGEFIALLGPSGCGKSTTLNIIAGLLPATGGGIWLDERRIDSLRPEDRGFGMVFQNYALFPHMSVARNIGFGLAMRGVARAEIARRVAEAVALVRLEGQEAKLPGQLSGGQQQRVAIARAIAIEPPLVLMDEPLSNLDAKLRLEMRAEIKRIHGALGATTIYVTHDQEEALSLADRIVVLKDGVVRQVGAPDDLFFRPAHLDVAEFVGFRNRLAGRVASVNGDAATVELPGGSRLTGRAAGGAGLAPGAPAVLALRPEDLHVAADGGPGDGAIPARVVSTEFRGREFVGIGRVEAGDGAALAPEAEAASAGALVFTAPAALAPGALVRLRADPARALVYPAAS